MNEVSTEQIECVFQSENQVPIFDRDNWNENRQSPESQKEIQLVVNETADQKIIDEVNKQIEMSKQNFFKVKVQKMEKKAIKSSKKIEAIKSVEHTNSILKQGYMQKKIDSIFFNWQKRYIVLTSQKLYSFENDKKEKLIGCVNLRLLPAKVKTQSDGLMLDFNGECENMVLKADLKSEHEKWKAWLEKVVSYHGHEDKLMLQTLKKPLYEAQDSLTEKQFLETAQTGDILLFYTLNTSAKIQRMLTSSEFDHVALVVKFPNKNLMVFESNQMYGVSIFEWKQYISFFNLYEKVTLRALNYVRKTDIQSNILTFVKKNLGKKYDISASKLLSYESDFNWEQMKEEEERGYFCSEVVAKAFKTAGLFESKKASGRYWPVDFSQKKQQLPFRKGASLGHEQNIVLNRHLKKAL